MASNNTSDIARNGVIGAGSFGFVIAQLLAENGPVLLYARRQEVVDEMTQQRKLNGLDLHENITPTSSLGEISGQCTMLWPTVPAAAFRELMQDMAPLLHPEHMMIHTTKGLDMSNLDDAAPEEYDREHICTMSQVIRTETIVRRIGCLAGPNLAGELRAGQPAATVIASPFDEVIKLGEEAIRSKRFQVYGTRDLLGVELAGALKNIMAIAAGALNGLGLGDNALALLITKGLAEMIRLGKPLGADVKAFLGVAGMGDLIATCSSDMSRNFSVGKRLAQGESFADIEASMVEVAEGVHTIRIVKHLADRYKIHAPITQILYRTLYGDMDAEQALKYLMSYRFNVDVDFL